MWPRVFRVLPTSPTTLFAAFYDPDRGDGSYRLQKSTDGGRTWTKADTGLPADVLVLDIIVGLRNPRQMFAATEGRGVFRSVDGGATWAPTVPR